LYNGCTFFAFDKWFVSKFITFSYLFQIRGQKEPCHGLASSTNICLEVGNGLQNLHESVQPLIIDRDIKTSNILLNKDLHVKIIDSNGARIFKEDELTMTQDIVGTM